MMLKKHENEMQKEGALREKCPNKELFLYFPVFGLNTL